MTQRSLLRGCLGAALGIALAMSAGSARASDPLPGDLIAPPVNINIGLFYNYFSDANRYDEPDGTAIKHDTHLSDDAVVARYIRIFDLAGFTSGVQGYIPYVIYAGSQSLGTFIPAPLPGFPPIGPGRAQLQSNDGFDQPNFSAFIYPINDPATGTYAVISPWISPPVSNFHKNVTLNPGTEHVWTYELEDGIRTTLFGRPDGRNLSVELWDTLYFYGHNNNSAIVNPEVDADAIPPLYQAFGIRNPVQFPSAIPATYRQQPSNEVRVYLPYEFFPGTRAFVAPGFYQSFGGKATYKVRGLGVVDAGSRTDETQLRLMAQTFVSPSLAIMLSGYYDVRARGGPLNRTLMLRLATFF